MRWEYVWSMSDIAWRDWMKFDLGKVGLQTVWDERIKDCTRCPLHKTRKQIVFGIGNTETPDFAFIGEAPGAQEDASGEPFIGKAGQLFNKMLNAMGYQREQVYITNVVSCRPPKNRDPELYELESCRPVWASQLMCVRPRMIVALGKIAGNELLKTSGRSISQMRERVHVWSNIPVQVTYHPASMLRNDSYKKPAWEDLKTALNYLKCSSKHKKESGPLFDL